MTILTVLISIIWFFISISVLISVIQGVLFERRREKREAEREKREAEYHKKRMTRY